MPINQTIRKPVSRIAVTRTKQMINVVIEGRTALIIAGAIAIAYIVYLGLPH